MESLIFAINAVMPIILMVLIGNVLKRIGLISKDFIKTANKLVFRLFLPSMLFLNVYNIESFANVSIVYAIYALCITFVLFGIAIPIVIFSTKRGDRRGAMLQASFRSNYALIGIPLAASLFGDEGTAVACILSAFTIPVFNVLAVISLSIFGSNGEKVKISKIILGIVKNPLIISVLSGCLCLIVREAFVGADIAFRLSDITPVFKVLNYLSGVATPLALIVLGAQFEFSAVPELKREIIIATSLRVILSPLAGLGLALLLFPDFTGAHYAALTALFATPVAVSSVPMAQEMGADTQLAGQLVVWTTVLSGFTIFIIAVILKSMGIFV